MKNNTPIASTGLATDVWILDAVRTPLSAQGGALLEVQPSALLAGLIGAIRRNNNLQGTAVSSLSSLVVGTAVDGSTAASSLPSALARANTLEKASTCQLEGGTECGAEAVRLAAAQIRTGEMKLALAGAIHLPSRYRAHGRVNPDVLGALAAHMVSPQVAADAEAALQGITASDIATYIEKKRNAGVPPALANEVESVLDLNGLTILDSDNLCSDNDGVSAVANSTWQAHRSLALKAIPQVGAFVELHSHQTEAPALEGASLLLLGSSDTATRLGLRTRARVVACAAAGHSRLFAVEAAKDAFEIALERVGWALDMVDRFEVSSRFAGIPLAFARSLGLDDERLNLNPSDWWHSNVGAVSPVIALSKLVEDLETAGLRRGALVAVGDTGGSVVILVDRENDD